MKKGIIFGIGFAAGIGVGLLIKAIIDKHHQEQEEEKEVEVPELLYFQNKKQEEEVTEPETELEEPEEEIHSVVDAVNNIIKQSGYNGTSKAERISEEEYDDEDDGYDKPEYFEYFVDTDELTNSDGEVLEPQGYYIGDVFDKVHFQTNDWDFIYIRNNTLMEKYKVNKQRDITKEDFFEY